MKLLKLFLVYGVYVFALGSCVKQAFDNPPDTSQYDPNLPVNAKLSDLSLNGFMMPVGKSRVLGDTTIYGIVVGDDRSGNIYKKIYIMDSSAGGMCLILDKTYLYGDYPVGRKVYVKLNGLTLINYKGTPEIVSSVDALGNTAGIPSQLITKYIIKASYPHTVNPIVVDPSDLFTSPQKYANTLVQLNGMQFDNVSKNVPYSESSNSTNRTVTNCDGTVKMNMYNSSYSLFQPAITPSGNGTIAGIISVYLSTPELVLRDTFDVRLTNPRCP